jgi:hypothetical protein
VLAGHVYYVRVIPHLGGFLARVELDPIKPGEREWSSLSRWLTDSNHLCPKITKLPARIEEAPIPDWAVEAWAELSTKEQAAHTLTPADGFPISPRQSTERAGSVARVGP